MEVFFYGLFMDEQVLCKKGVNPSNPRKGVLHDYTLKIGSRASLIPRKNENAYGIVMTIADEDVQKLYAEPSVADYLPEVVNVLTDAGDFIITTCYNLPEASLTGTNARYAESLFTLARQLGFPEKYLAQIKAMAQSNS